MGDRRLQPRIQDDRGGKLTAEMLVHGHKPDELKPFTLDRYRTGATFGNRNSNCPWV